MSKLPENFVPILAAGQRHGVEEGFLCAMQMESFANGDAQITDFPSCADHTAARIVQAVNDAWAEERGSAVPIRDDPQDAWQVVAAADVPKILALGALTRGTKNILKSVPVTEWLDWLHDRTGSSNSWEVYEHFYDLSRRSPEEGYKVAEYALRKLRELMGLDDVEVLVPEVLFA